MRNLWLSFFALAGSLAVTLSAQPGFGPAAAGAGDAGGRSVSDRRPSGASAWMDRAGVLWLCRPGIAHDPCMGDLSATIVQPGRTDRIARAHSASDPPIDCFYVYPTASTQSTPNAALRVDPGIVAAAQLQAMRFSQVCKVYAPVYRQLTITGLMQTGIGGSKSPSGTPPANSTEPYADVAAAWKDYLEHDNHGRGVVLIGHSQGSFMLIQLIRQQIEDNRGALNKVVSVIIPGGNVEEDTGTPAAKGSTFKHLPPCRSTHNLQCVVAYSSFPSMPPFGAIFGRTNGPTSGGSSVSLGAAVVCVNPAQLVDDHTSLSTFFPRHQDPLAGPGQSKITTPWVEYSGIFSASCQTRDGATWLQISQGSDPGVAPLAESLGPGWGFHLDDINLPLGNLVSVVCEQSGVYIHRRLACPTS